MKRTNADFKALRELLMRQFPQTMMPPLPNFSPRKKLTPKQIVKKEVYYQRFLKQVLKSMLLRSSDILVDFLKETTDFSKYLTERQTTLTFPKQLTDFLTLTGSLSTQASEDARRFVRSQLPSYI